jgi:error-prone DNA polymerase
MRIAYAELHCLSAFSFGRGASSADELFARARREGYAALAITDECSVAGLVRALEASERHGVPLVCGAEFTLADGLKLVLLCETLAGWRELCRIITLARRRAPKGDYVLRRSDLESLDASGLFALWCPPPEPAMAAAHDAGWFRRRFPQRAWLAIELHRGPDDAARLAALRAFASRHGLPCVAAGDVHLHVRRRRALQDALVAIRHGVTLAEAGWRLFPNGERHLRSRRALAAIYPKELLEESIRIAERCRFSPRQLEYRYPRELVPDGETPTTWLRRLTRDGAMRRWPDGVPAAVARQLDHELALIAELGYEAFFLTVHDVVRFARERGILCQGRGSAANSAVCFALGITEVDPARMHVLFERFLSRERNEPPDIDVDFEHERREEVIQYVYAKYGRERAALAATVISWQPKSAARELAKVLGLPRDQQDAVAHAVSRTHGEVPLATRLAEQGLDPDSRPLRQLVALMAELVDLPRHLSQHVGGFVIADEPLSTLVPVENAAMPERTIIQWDKDDLETLGLLKVDVLALGMLTCIRKALALVGQHRGRRLTLATIPAEDPDTYDMLCRGDSIGVFQVESRAQQAMLPRLKPRSFYDLVIEVAIVRPGPIQGQMVHPYLRRRQGLEPVSFPSPELESVFGRTLGVPIFQEQVMHLAVVAAGFTPGEADQLRRSMAAWKRRGGLDHYRDKVLSGMTARGYDLAFAEQVFEQIKGFGSYGFPESHAASFALLVYASAWLKCHEPAAFACALLNALPMGFYGPAQIVGDARRHGVEVRPVDVLASDWDSTLEPSRATGGLALRLGFRMVSGLKREAIERLVAARRARPFADVADFATRAGLDHFQQQRLAEAGAMRRLAGHRHRARWALAGIERALPIEDRASDDGIRVALRPPDARDDLRADYATVGLTLGAHPLAQLRGVLARRGVRRSDALAEVPHGGGARHAGLVVVRQRPSSAGGVTFVTLEDELGLVNVVVWRQVAQRFRRALLEARLLVVSGEIQRADGVQHLIARHLEDASDLLGGLRHDAGHSWY